MAKQTYVRIVSDLSGEVLEEGKGETLTFGFGKNRYTIDLSNAEADEFRKVMQKYTSVAAQEVDRLPRASSAKKSDKERLAAIREWAGKNGYTVSERGRIKADIVEAYDAAH